jgi:hypothetical protein
MLGWRQAATGSRGAMPPPTPAAPLRRARAALCAPDEVPSSPLRPDHREAIWRRVLIPLGREQHRARACPHIVGALEHALGPLARHGDAPLLPQTPGAPRSGWGCREDRLSQPQEHRPRAARAAPCAPPCACRQVGAAWQRWPSCR